MTRHVAQCPDTLPNQPKGAASRALRSIIVTPHIILFAMFAIGILIALAFTALRIVVARRRLIRDPGAEG